MDHIRESDNANTIDLESSTASHITNVSLYSGRADITRLFEFEIKAGMNVVSIVGLPRSLQENNVRVEGLGNASIHNVVIGKTETPPDKISRLTRYSTTEAPIARSRKETKNSLKTARKRRSALDSYLTTIATRYTTTDVSQLEQGLDGYTRLAEELDKQILDLEEKLEEITSHLRDAKGKESSQMLVTPSWKITVSLHGNIDERVKLSITYAVCSADWTPCYDVRVTSQTTEEKGLTNLTVTYKAIITQATGESWENVPLTLGTVTPSFGVQAPILGPWIIDSYQRTLLPLPGVPMGGMPMSSVSSALPQPIVIQAESRSTSRSPSRQMRRRRHSRSSSVSSDDLPRYQPAPPMMQQPIVVPVSNKGDIVATFKIPGVITVHDNQGQHNVNVAELTMQTTLMWYAIPAVDSAVYLKARTKNDSEYTFVPGSANVYVDGSFVATTRLASVSPQETFDCPLGLDRSIRITYHPLEKKSAKTGFVTKTTSKSFTQRISVLNTKSNTVRDMKVIDRLPVSADEKIEVKLLNPGLTMPSSSSGQPGVNNSTQKGSTAVLRPLRVSENVIAQWDGADSDPASDVSQDGIGRNGKINWVMSIPPQTTVSLVLQFDVVYPENMLVQGV